MKATLLIVSALALTAVSCQGQSVSASKVPSVVVNKVQQAYPGAKDIDWKKSKENFEAEVKTSDSTEVDVVLNSSGNVIMEKHEIKISDIPAEVSTGITALYKDYMIDEVEKVTKNGVVYYQVELEAKGKKDVNVVFNSNGKQEKSMTYWD